MLHRQVSKLTTQQLLGTGSKTAPQAWDTQTRARTPAHLEETGPEGGSRHPVQQTGPSFSLEVCRLCQAGHVGDTQRWCWQLPGRGLGKRMQEWWCFGPCALPLGPLVALMSLAVAVSAADCVRAHCRAERGPWDCVLSPLLPVLPSAHSPSARLLSIHSAPLPSPPGGSGEWGSGCEEKAQSSGARR